jgi:hypothetical protein
MDPLQDLYKTVSDSNILIAKRKEALSKLLDLHLSNDVVEVLSRIATDSTLPFEIRQKASDKLIKKAGG